MRTWQWAAVAAALLLVDPTPGRAQEEPATPTPSAGRPTPERAAALPAARACGRDRRCRLARLRARSRARAFSGAAAAHLVHLDVQEVRRRARDAQVPRRRRRFTAGPVVTDYRFGGLLGVHPIPQLWVGVGLAVAFSEDIFRFLPEGGDSIIIPREGPVISGEVRWLVLTSHLTPYASAGFHIRLGDAFVSTRSGTEFTFADPRMEIHYAHFGLGLDLQLDFGLRIRAGAVLRPLVYVRFREMGEPLPETQRAFEGGWRILGAEGTIGWAI